jgi:cytochrome c oxidase assembly protein subunit 11
MTELRDKNTKIARILLVVIIVMVALSFAAVPLYKRFCQMTGFGGTPLISKTLPDHILKRRITISFDARVDSSLPWDFKPEQRKTSIAIGQQGIMSFTADNLSAKETTGTAVYNITPDKAGAYFHKTQCFCFAQQSLKPGGNAHFPVMFFVDPSINDDPEMDDVTDITLSYTFYAADSKALDKAISTYGQKPRQ